MSTNNNAMSNITVKHYLNKKLKPFYTGIENTYPVYTQILIGRDVLRIKSPLIAGDKLFNYFGEKQFNDDVDLQKTLSNESKLIKFILKNSDEFKNSDLSDAISNLNKSICNEILNSELSLQYFEYFQIVENPDFFNILKYYLSKYLSDKSNIGIDFFTNNIDIQNTFDYKNLTGINFIENQDIKEIFEVVIKLREFEKLNYTIKPKSFTNYTSEKPLNIYEWFFNGGNEKFCEFFGNDAKENKYFEKIINSINQFCLIILYEIPTDSNPIP